MSHPSNPLINVRRLDERLIELKENSPTRVGAYSLQMLSVSGDGRNRRARTTSDQIVRRGALFQPKDESTARWKAEIERIAGWNDFSGEIHRRIPPFADQGAFSHSDKCS